MFVPCICKAKKLTIALAAMFEPLPEYEESHVGPYGVEVPLHWDFVVKLTEATVAVNVDVDNESCSGPVHNDGEPDKDGE